MSQENLQFRFSQCKDDGISSTETSQVQQAPSQPPEQSFAVIRHESSQNSDDSQQEFERAEFDRIIQPPSPTSSQTTDFDRNSQISTNSQQVEPPSESQKSENSVNENAPAFQWEVNLIDPAEVMNMDGFNSQSEAIVNGPSGPDTVSSQSSNED